VRKHEPAPLKRVKEASGSRRFQNGTRGQRLLTPPHSRNAHGDQADLSRQDLQQNVGDVASLTYVATFPEAVYVLHVFVKRSRTTARRDLALGKERYQAMQQERRKS